MGMDDLAKGALVLIGVGMISKRYGAGVGLGELGTGVTTLVAAPGMGVGAGLSGVAGGIREIAETFGDVGRGISALFGGFPEWALPKGDALPGGEDPRFESYQEKAPLLTVSGGDKSQLDAGGGSNVPQGNGIYQDPRYAGSPWTFKGAPTLWFSEATAMKHYKAAQDAGTLV